MKQALAISRKELKTYFGSPTAAIFIGMFLLTALFSFFWVETFFARNIADLRPLFQWMPLLLVFLAAALTMRQWSEEQRMGTMEILLTMPVSTPQLVAGKFLAVLTLVAVALALTAGLPITVSLLGELDWGPVIGGYLGALLMASTYIAIGLFVSARTDNQIVALITTVLLNGLFYLVGSTGITGLVGDEAGETLRFFGTGSRFLSIERGVIDVRDLAYYLSLTALFLLLNGYVLEKKRWSGGSTTAPRRRAVTLAALLAAGNLLALNLWLGGIAGLRVDLTANREYSISAPSRDLLGSLQEPLVLRGYFSEKTHPLLAPLVPRIKDLMSEYAAVSGGRVSVSFVDPKFDAEAEQEANQQYGIKPVPFQVAGRYEAGVVNSYFNVLVLYGDQYVTLGFEDLIELERRKDGQLDVRLRNLEYDLSRSIKKAAYGFQGLDTVFANINREMKLSLIVTPSTLPEALADLPVQVETAAQELIAASGGRLVLQRIDPDDPSSPMDRAAVKSRFDIEPLALSFFSDKAFYLHLLLEAGENREDVFLRPGMTGAEIRQGIEAALKRSASGFLKTIGIWTPPAMPAQPFMVQAPPENQYNVVRKVLRENYHLEDVDLTAGHVPAEIDVLLLVAPQGMSDQERFAVDQHLMRGGSVVALAGSHVLDLQAGTQAINLRRTENGIGELLRHYGIRIEEALVMDAQNEPFPIPVSRDVGGFVVQEIQQMNYPFFVDVRREGMAADSPVSASLAAVTMNWVSPLVLEEKSLKEVRATALLHSSPESWLHYGTEVQPDFHRYPRYGFAAGEDLRSQVLAVSLQGSFVSYFADREDPRLAAMQARPGEKKKAAAIDGTEQENIQPPLAPVIRKTSSARLVVVGSSEFVSDPVIGISQNMGQDRFMNGLAFLQNAVDWAVEDEGLLAIRSRGTHARLLYPLERSEQIFWEWLNYGIALAALVIVSYYGARRQHREESLLKNAPATPAGEPS